MSLQAFRLRGPDSRVAASCGSPFSIGGNINQGYFKSTPRAQAPRSTRPLQDHSNGTPRAQKFTATRELPPGRRLEATPAKNPKSRKYGPATFCMALPRFRDGRCAEPCGCAPTETFKSCHLRCLDPVRHFRAFRSAQHRRARGNTEKVAARNSEWARRPGTDTKSVTDALPGQPIRFLCLQHQNPLVEALLEEGREQPYFLSSQMQQSSQTERFRVGTQASDSLIDLVGSDGQRQKSWHVVGL